MPLWPALSVENMTLCGCLEPVSKMGINRVLGGAPTGRTTQNPEFHNF